jgi:hypothetical protein
VLDSIKVKNRGGWYHPKKFTFDKVFYQRNVDLGLDPTCHECHCYAKTAGGYPQVKRNNKRWLLHRYIWWEATGEEPEVVLHLCDNRSCVNLDHLKGSTYKANVRDADLKERSARKLSHNAVVAIRERYSEGCSQPLLAKEFGVGIGAISAIVTGKTYTYLGGPLTCVKDKRPFTSAQVKLIRFLCNEGAKQKTLAAMLAVNNKTISQIVRNETYKDVGSA